MLVGKGPELLSVCVKSAEDGSSSEKDRSIIIGATVGSSVAIGFILMAIIVWKVKVKDSVKKKK